MTPGYLRAQIILHWLVAVVIVAQFVFSGGIDEAFDLLQENGIRSAAPLVNLHVAFGFTILALTAARLVLRFQNGAPPPPEGTALILIFASKTTHWAIYALLLAMPVSGAVAWFGVSEVAADAHEAATTILLILAGLHIAAALFHQFYLRDNLLDRMRTPRD